MNRTLELKFFDALNTIYDMVYSTDIIVRSCSVGFVQSGQKLYSYLNIFGTPKVFMENIIHNFGFLVDSLRDMYYFFGYDVRGRFNEPYDVG